MQISCILRQSILWRILSANRLAVNELKSWLGTGGAVPVLRPEGILPR